MLDDIETALSDALRQLFQQHRHDNGFVTAGIIMEPPSLQVFVVNMLFPIAQKYVENPSYLGFPVVVKGWQEMWSKYSIEEDEVHC